MNTTTTFRKLITLIINENWEKYYKNGSNDKELGFNDESKTLYEPKKTKKKIHDYLILMGLIKTK